MSSTQDTCYRDKVNKMAAKAMVIIAKNISDIEPADALAASESFRQMGWNLDKIAMTKAQRDEIDMHIANLSVIFDEQP